MRLSLSSKVPPSYDRGAWTRIVQDIERQANLLGEGRLQGTHNAYTAAPTTGTHAVGDFVKNSAPAVAGSAGSRYIILGWVCTVAGTPGTWVECRTLTGT